MPRLSGILLSSALLASAPLWSQANPSPPDAKPEVAAVLDKMAEALGGWAKVRSVRAIRTKRTGRLLDKPYQSDTVLLPDRLRQEDNRDGYPRTVIFSPQAGIAFAPGHTYAQATTSETASWSSTFRFDFFFVLQRVGDPAYEFSVQGGEKIGEADTRILEVKAYGVRDWLYVGLQTGRVLRDVKSYLDGRRETSDYSDWNTADGMTLPLANKWGSQDAKGETTAREIQITAIEFNPPVDERLFLRDGPTLADTPFHPAPMLPAPEPPRTANLSIKTQPGGAQAYLNDEFRGMSSSEGNLSVSNLKPGSYRLRLSLIGYQEWKQALSLVAGDSKTVAVKLEPAGPKPLELNEIEEALKNGISAKRVTELVKQYGVDFALADEVEQRLRALGADDALLLAISKAKK